MSNAEHLIENALVCLENGGSFEGFAAGKHNQLMSAYSNINLMDVWQMAVHVYYSIKPEWEHKAVQSDRAWDPLPDFPSSIC